MLMKQKMLREVNIKSDLETNLDLENNNEYTKRREKSSNSYLEYSLS